MIIIGDYPTLNDFYFIRSIDFFLPSMDDYSVVLAQCNAMPALCSLISSLISCFAFSNSNQAIYVGISKQAH